MNPHSVKLVKDSSLTTIFKGMLHNSRRLYLLLEAGVAATFVAVYFILVLVNHQ